MRICSLLPSATELVCALGLEDRLVAVTHECDYPPSVRRLPAVTESWVPKDATSREIDRFVARARHAHRSVYRLDMERLEAVHPDLILTQELCDVCAVAYEQVAEAARVLPGRPRVISLEPLTLEHVLDQLEVIGRETGTLERARALRQQLVRRIDAVRRRTAGLARPRVYVMEWLDPPWAAGHWVPEMVEAAGGREVLGTPGSPSRRLSWDEVLAARPEVIVLAPCGFDLGRVLEEWARIDLPPGWGDLPAVREGRVYAVDANSYFSRPAPRLVDGIEILGQILHPEVFGTSRSGRDWMAVSPLAAGRAGAASPGVGAREGETGEERGERHGHSERHGHPA